MKDHEKRELVSELVGIARIAHGTEQLRDRIAYALSDVFSELDEATARAERAVAELLAAQKRFKAQHTLQDPVEHALVLLQEREKLAAELKKAMEQEPVFYYTPQAFGMNTAVVSRTPWTSGMENIPLYATPIPAPAAQAPQGATCKKPLQVPNEWREVLSGLIAIAEKKGSKQGSPNHSHRRTNIWDDDNGPDLAGKPCLECAMYDKARALLQEVKP